jgi:hypothetical protein
MDIKHGPQYAHHQAHWLTAKQREYVSSLAALAIAQTRYQQVPSPLPGLPRPFYPASISVSTCVDQHEHDPRNERKQWIDVSTSLPSSSLGLPVSPEYNNDKSQSNEHTTTSDSDNDDSFILPLSSASSTCTPSTASSKRKSPPSSSSSSSPLLDAVPLVPVYDVVPLAPQDAKKRQRQSSSSSSSSSSSRSTTKVSTRTKGTKQPSTTSSKKTSKSSLSTLATIFGITLNELHKQYVAWWCNTIDTGDYLSQCYYPVELIGEHHSDAIMMAPPYGPASLMGQQYVSACRVKWADTNEDFDPELVPQLHVKRLGNLRPIIPHEVPTLAKNQTPVVVADRVLDASASSGRLVSLWAATITSKTVKGNQVYVKYDNTRWPSDWALHDYVFVWNE